MNYATPYHIGNYQNPTVQTAEATAQTVGRVCRLDETTQRCRRDKKRPTEVSSGGDASNAFLKCAFLPKLKENETVIDRRKSKRLERDFYQSLSNLTEHYQIDQQLYQQFKYPYNIALGIDNVQKQLKNKIRDWEEINLIRDKGMVYFTSEERYNTGATLYYIPVLPLYRLFKIKARKISFQLLLSVYSYLYRIVDIPYYRHEAGYLYWTYDMLEQWASEDDETAESSTLMTETKQAQLLGDLMEKKICNHQNLERFEIRLQQFNPKDDFDLQCLQVAQTAFSLLTQFPNSTIFKNAQAYSTHNCDDEEDCEDFENMVTMDKYISFCADAKGYLFHNLFQSVNNELQEYGQMQEPVIIKHFTGSNDNPNNLDFENQIFDLITELIDLMNDL